MDELPVEHNVTGAPAIAAGIVLSVIASAEFLTLPLVVDGAVGTLGYSEQQVGFLSASLMLGFMVSAIAAGLWIRRWPWRTVARVALGGLCAAAAASLVFHGVWVFLSLQFAAGVFGGSLLSLALTTLSDSKHPDRSFGFSLAAQVIYQVAGLLIGPVLLRLGGINGVLMIFVAGGAIALAVVPALPKYGRYPIAKNSAGVVTTTSAMFALAGCFFFFANVGAYWTYIEIVARAAGLGAQVVGNCLSIGAASGIIGALLASWCGERYGRILPVAVSAVVIVAAVLLLWKPPTAGVLLASAVLYNVAWNLSLAYQYAIVNALDGTGRAVAVTPAFQAAGGAAGPAVAALLVTATGFHSVIWLSGVAALLSLGLFVVSSVHRAATAARYGSPRQLRHFIG